MKPCRKLGLTALYLLSAPFALAICALGAMRAEARSIKRLIADEWER